MTISDLKQVTLDIISEIYHKNYIGILDVQKLDPIGYCIKLGMNTPYQPITIYAELNDADFLKFLRQEIKDRRFNLVRFCTANLTHPYECNPINKACSCHDKGRIN